MRVPRVRAIQESGHRVSVRTRGKPRTWRVFTIHGNRKNALVDATGEPVARWSATDGYPTELTTYFDEDGFGREIVTISADEVQRVAP